MKGDLDGIENHQAYIRCLENALDVIRSGVKELSDSTFITDRGRKITKRVLEATSSSAIKDSYAKKSDVPPEGTEI